jgi:chemotaxis family two-component system sensor kinase Cph1
LLTNAIRFRSDRPLTIHVGCQRRRHDWLFSLRDTGRGFDGRYAHDVFRVFHRLQAEDDQGSTGMGLAVARRIVELHGWAMWVESEPGVGSCFYFTLPLAGERGEEV